MSVALMTEAHMAAFAPDDYSAFGSFHPPYIEVERFFFEQRDWHTQRVFHALTIHADSIGCSFIGRPAIGELVGLSVTNVNRALLRLGDLGWLRAHIVNVPSRRQHTIDWQLSPAVIYIAPAHIQTALQVWEAGISKLNEIINQQPESLVNQNQNQRKQPTPDNQNQNHHHHQNQRLESAQTLAEGRDKVDPEFDPPDQREAQTPATNGRRLQQPQKQGSAPPLPDLELCRQPLTDAAAEEMAGTVQVRLGTRIVQARQLVLRFDPLTVYKAIEWLEHEVANGYRVRSRFGLVRSWLENDVILEDDDPRTVDRKKYISGKYADSILS